MLIQIWHCTMLKDGYRFKIYRKKICKSETQAPYLITTQIISNSSAQKTHDLLLWKKSEEIIYTLGNRKLKFGVLLCVSFIPNTFQQPENNCGIIKCSKLTLY